MIIYNVTLKVDWSVDVIWRQWMQDIYIPEIIRTNCFQKFLFVHLLEVDETDGPTYAVQYFAKSLKDYNSYVQTHAAHFSKIIGEKWGDKCMAFGTLMEAIE